MYFILMNKEVERSKVTQDALSLQNVVIEKVKKKRNIFHRTPSGEWRYERFIVSCSLDAKFYVYQK